jgi:hypothetical protein
MPVSCLTLAYIFKLRIRYRVKVNLSCTGHEAQRAGRILLSLLSPPGLGGGQTDASAAFLAGKEPSTHWTRDRLCTRVSLHVSGSEKIIFHWCSNSVPSRPYRSLCELQLSLYTSR